jgi:hypothetical protein
MAVDEAAFRRLALALPDAEEGWHEGLPTFLVRSRRFATLGWPDARSASVILRVDERDVLAEMAPGTLTPAAGAWGAKGHSVLHLDVADAEAVARVLRAAWRRVAPKGLIAE